MAVPLEAFLADLYLAGSFGGSPGELRAALDAGAVVQLSDVTIVPIAQLSSAAEERSPVGSVAPDEILLASVPPDPDAPMIHKVYFPVELTLGPYTVEGRMGLLPGFDAGRALTRPSAYFVELRDAVVSIATGGEGLDQPYELLSVNRFAVERVVSETDVTFWFPGAEQEFPGEEAPAPEEGPTTA